MMGKSHDEYMIERFRANPAYAASLVNDILEDGDDQGELKLILRHIAAAGLKVSFEARTPKPRQRAKAAAAKIARRPPPVRPRTRRSAAVATA